MIYVVTYSYEEAKRVWPKIRDFLRNNTEGTTEHWKYVCSANHLISLDSGDVVILIPGWEDRRDVEIIKILLKHTTATVWTP